MLSDDELHLLQEELGHHQRKMDEFQDLKTEYNELQGMNVLVKNVFQIKQYFWLSLVLLQCFLLHCFFNEMLDHVVTLKIYVIVKICIII